MIDTEPRRNPAAGETLTFLSPEGAPDLRIALDVAAVHHAPPVHVHPTVVESFTVTVGELEIRVGRRWRTVRAGQGVTVPPGVVHGYRNTSGRPARVEVTVSPEAGLRGFFTELFDLAEAGRLGPTGAPGLPQTARLLLRYPQTLAPVLPAAVQRVLLRVLARFDRR